MSRQRRIFDENVPGSKVKSLISCASSFRGTYWYAVTSLWLRWRLL
jgi:hypothetical protein